MRLSDEYTGANLIFLPPSGYPPFLLHFKCFGAIRLTRLSLPAQSKSIDSISYAPCCYDLGVRGRKPSGYNGVTLARFYVLQNIFMPVSCLFLFRGLASDPQ